MTNSSSKPKRFGEVVPIQAAALARAVELELVQPNVDWDARDREVAAARRAQQAAEARERAKRRERDMASAGFPRRAIEAATAPTDTPAMRGVRAWRPTPGSNVLVLLGGAGAGKTVAATWWAMQRDHAPAFERASSFAATSRYERAARDRVLRAPTLVLDDLGAEYADAKGSFLTDLDELIDVFYGDGRTLLITSNLASVDALRDRYQARVADRLRECATFWACGGRSLRGGS